MTDIELTHKNFLVYAMKAYNNPHCMDTNEFSEDIKRIKYVKRLFRKYSETKVLRTRLILNHTLQCVWCRGSQRDVVFKSRTEYVLNFKNIFSIFKLYER